MAVTARNVKQGKKFSGEPAFSKYLPYSYHVTDHVISTINGEYITLFKIRGRTHDCASDAELLRWHRDLNEMLKSIGNEHVKFWTHQHHHEVYDFPESNFELTFPRMFDDSYRRSFQSVPLMVNDLYLTVIYNPIGDAAQKVFAMFDKPSRQDLDDLQADALASLDEVTDQLMGGLKAYGIERLGIYYRDRTGEVCDVSSKPFSDIDAMAVGLEEGAFDVDPDDLLADTVPDDEPVPALTSNAAADPSQLHAYSTALEWLGFLCNGEWEPVPVCRGRIREYLMNNRIVSSFWGDVLQRRKVDSVDYLAGIEIRDYDESTEPGQLNLLMEADFEYVLTQSFCCMGRASAEGFLSKQQSDLLETKDKSKSQIQAMEDAADHVASRRFIMGWHHATLHVWGNSAQEVQKKTRKARVLFSQCAIKTGSVGLTSEAAFYAVMPGNGAYAPRPVPINSWNFLCFSPFHNFMTGKPNNNPWGPAVTMFKTTAGTPLFFNFHASLSNENSYGKRPPGNTLILGRVGSGKTTLLNALLTQASKFKPRMFCYDKDRGMMQLVTALGGRYKVLREKESTGWQPAQLEPTKANVAMVKRLMRVLAETTNNGPVDESAVLRINAGVDHVMVSGLIPHNLRSITAIVRQMPRAAKTTENQKLNLTDLLNPWCRAGEHGWVFDNPADELDLNTHDVYGWDVTEFIVAKDQPAPPARAPMLMYLNYRVRQSIDGHRRVVQVFDEFAQYLDDPIMDIEIKRGLKTDRKKDCIYVFSTQEPNDALDSRIGKTIMQQCVTKLLLENPDADPDDYKKGLKLTDAEFEAMLSIPEFSRQFLVKQGSQSTLAVMDLKNMDREISILSGTPDNADRLESILKSLGHNNPDIWLPLYWEAVIHNRR